MYNIQKSVTVQNFVSHEQSFRVALKKKKKKKKLENKDIFKFKDSLGIN